MDEFERIELMRALTKLDKIDELVAALENASEELGDLSGSIDAFTHELSFARRIKEMIDVHEVETKEVDFTDRNRFNYWVGIKAMADRKLADGVIELAKELGLVLNTNAIPKKD